MAVQAQCPSNAFFPDFRGGAPDACMHEAKNGVAAGLCANRIGHPRGNVAEELHMQMQALQDRSLLAAAYNQNNGGTVFSSPQSDLTCNNGSASRKRAREHLSAALLPIPSAAFVPVPASKVVASAAPVEGRLGESSLTSTSGRPAMASSPSSLPTDLIAQLYQHNVEIDALVRLQNERLRVGLEEVRKRQCRAVARAVEQGAARRLREKEAELESARRRNAELEERVRQMGAECQAWFNLAKSHEAVAAGLRATLDQLLLHGTAAPGDMAEGFGDSDAIAAADDAQSCCFELKQEEEEEKPRTKRWGCKVCGEEEVCVLLLPCRHLCLCKACEAMVDTCPLCLASKNASLQISMP